MAQSFDFTELSERLKVVSNYRVDCMAYFHRRWGRSDDCDELASSLINDDAIGWSEGLEKKGTPWSSTHPLIVPLYGHDGEVVSAMRRYAKEKHGGIKTKTMALSCSTLGVEKYPVCTLGNPAAQLKASSHKTLFIAEGEIDFLLLNAMALCGMLKGGVVGVPGGMGRQPFWEGLGASYRKLAEKPVKVVFAAHDDEAGEKLFELAQVHLPDLVRPAKLWTGAGDMTDIMLGYGREEVCALLNTAQDKRARFFQFDGGGYAYLRGGSWRMVTSQTAMASHLRNAGYTKKESFDEVKVLPAAAGTRFDPKTQENTLVDDGQVWLNEYSGLPFLAPRTGDAWLLRRLVQHLCGPNADYMFDWMAAPLKSLYHGTGALRTRVAVVLYGPEQGAGKGWLSEVLEQIYGRYYQEVGQDAIEDQYTPLGLSKTLMLVLDEVCSNSRTQQRKVLDKLKGWVTNDQINYRPMRHQSFMAPAWFNMLFLSNAMSPVVAEEFDRRYPFIRVSGGKMDDEFIQLMREQKKAGWPMVEPFIMQLLDRKIGREWFDPLDNAEREVQLRLNEPSESRFLDEIAAVGIRSIAQEWAEEESKRIEGQVEWCAQRSVDGMLCAIPKTVFWKIYNWWSRNNGYRGILRRPLLVEYFSQHLRGIDGDARLWMGDRRVRCIGGLPYDIARVEAVA